MLVEDQADLNKSITQSLRKEGFLCESATRFLEADEKMALHEYDALIVDINLPDGSGLDLIRAMKKQAPSTGIIVISARDSLDNKIEGLELGADDYITKPFDIAELIARVKSLLRRRSFSGSETLHFCGADIEINNRLVKVKGESIALTKSEYDILLFFASNPTRVLTKESIAEHIWGDNMDLADSFDFIYSHIKNIRKKLTDAGADNPFKVVYGIGYKANV